MKRLLIWSVAVASTSVLACLALPSGTCIPNKTATVSMFVLGSFAGFGAFVYHFARFALCKEIRYLLSGIGFVCLSGISAAQVVADIKGYTPSLNSGPVVAGYFLSALFFACGACSRSKWRPSTKRETYSQLIVSAVVSMALPSILFGYSVSAAGLRAVHFSSVNSWCAVVMDAGAGLIALVLVGVALNGHYRRCADGERLSALGCYFLVPFALGLVFRVASALLGSDIHGLSQIMFSISWLVPVVGVGIEDAITFREASDRLVELETLHTVSWALVGVGTVYELLELFVRTLTSDLGARVAAVYLGDEEGQNLELAATCGLEGSEAAIGRQFSVFSTDRRPGFHTGHTVKAFVSREMQIVSDVFVDVEFVPWRVVAVDDGCAASLPLVDRGKSIGVVNLYFSDRNQLTRQRVELLVTIATAATPAVENVLARERGESIRGIDLDRAA